MKIIHKPSVKIVAETKFNEEEFKEYLFENDIIYPDTSPPSDIEKLIEVGGRICYNSYSSPRPGGNKAYLNNILSSGHGCYDSHTQVLTYCGWKHWKDITKEDKLYTLNKDCKIEYQNPTNIISSFYSGDMYRICTKDVDLLVTPNHRLLIAGKDKKYESLEIVNAESINNKFKSYLKNCKGINDYYLPDTNYLNKDILYLLGAYLVRGHENKIYYELERQNSNIKDILKFLQWEYKEYEEYFLVNFSPDYLPLFSIDSVEKIFKYSPYTISYKLLHSAIDYGGLIHKSRGVIETSIQVANLLQHIALHAGTYGNIRNSGTNRYILDVRMSKNNSEIFRYAEINKISDWSGDIYCAEVPNGILYVRRNGKPVWCGNSVIEHGNVSFLISGVSRSLAMELIRHRAGTAISMRSQRYCEEGKTVVKPPLLEKDSKEYKKWKKRVKRTLKGYKKLVKDLVGKERKEIRECARSLLPECSETKFVWTINMRALRNFLELRGSIHADKEINRLAFEIFRKVKDKYPNLFGDYTDKLVTEYKKV